MTWARALNPTFGDGVMWGLLFLYCTLLVTPIVLWFKVPKRMALPSVAEGPEYERYSADFRKRLARNARLRGCALTSIEEVDGATLQINRVCIAKTTNASNLPL